MPKILLEICVDDAAGFEAAVAGGADRIELCSALSVGGLTPSIGLIKFAAKFPIPTYAMVRPRAGDFVYSADEIEMMQADIASVRECGLAGIVIGASKVDGTLNSSQLRALIAQANGLGLSLHRAFDLVTDFHSAIDTAIELGFERVLTSGGATSASEGIATLSDCMNYAAGRIKIMPGGGINVAAALTLLDKLPVQELHASCSTIIIQNNSRLSELGFFEVGSKVTDQSKVQALRKVLNEFSDEGKYSGGI